jgi:SAM-dependent methyltransferase
MYYELCTDVYDLTKPLAPEQEFAFYLAYAERAQGTILEPMCGSGRFLLPLLQRGFDVHGTDASASMLAACRRRAAKLALDPLLHQQRFEEMELERRYALVFIPTGSFGLVTDSVKVRDGLTRLHACMLPGAKLVFEAELPVAEESFSFPWSADRHVQRPDGNNILMSWAGRYDAEERMKYSWGRYELIDPNGRVLQTELQQFDIRYYEPEQLEELLISVGFVEPRRHERLSFRGADAKDGSFVIEVSRP